MYPQCLKKAKGTGGGKPKHVTANSGHIRQQPDDEQLPEKIMEN